MLLRSPTFAKGRKSSAGLKEFYLSKVSLTPELEKTRADGLNLSANQLLMAALVDWDDSIFIIIIYIKYDLILLIENFI
jgi:hypothetical protein